MPYRGAQSPFTVAGWAVNPIPTSANFILYNNYPNPFNSTTRLAFVLKNEYSVNIEVYDLLGRKMRTIFNGELTKGFHPEFGWDGGSDNGQDVASGVYFIRVDVAGSVKVLKSLYLK